jgi:hypothetical protein
MVLRRHEYGQWYEAGYAIRNGDAHSEQTQSKRRDWKEVHVSLRID